MAGALLIGFDNSTLSGTGGQDWFYDIGNAGTVIAGSGDTATVHHSGGWGYADRRRQQRGHDQRRRRRGDARRQQRRRQSIGFSRTSIAAGQNGVPNLTITASGSGVTGTVQAGIVTSTAAIPTFLTVGMGGASTLNIIGNSGTDIAGSGGNADARQRHERCRVGGFERHLFRCSGRRILSKPVRAATSSPSREQETRLVLGGGGDIPTIAAGLAVLDQGSSDTVFVNSGASGPGGRHRQHDHDGRERDPRRRRRRQHDHRWSERHDHRGLPGFRCRRPWPAAPGTSIRSAPGSTVTDRLLQRCRNRHR